MGKFDVTDPMTRQKIRAYDFCGPLRRENDGNPVDGNSVDANSNGANRVDASLIVENPVYPIDEGVERPSQIESPEREIKMQDFQTVPANSTCLIISVIPSLSDS